MIDERLLALLVCPVTRGPLRYDAERQELVSETAGLAYPISDGIPVMLPEEARTIGGTESRSSLAKSKGVSSEPRPSTALGTSEPPR